MPPEDGVIVGADATQEWLLPWWWDNYQKHNAFSVSFFDFGMTESMKKWCRSNGSLYSLRLSSIFIKEKAEVACASEWEQRYGEQFWTSRESWFKKPIACLQSPYKRTIWLDLDCEVVGSIAPLFPTCDSHGFAIAKDQSTPTYNSGVMVFQKNVPLIQQWADRCFKDTDLFRGDQDLLTHIIAQKHIPIYQLPQIYNWNVGYGLNPSTVIYHWVGDIGKAVLKNQLILKDL